MKRASSGKENLGELKLIRSCLAVAEPEGRFDFVDSSIPGDFGGHHLIGSEAHGLAYPGPTLELVVDDGLVLGLFVSDRAGQKAFLPRVPGLDTVQLVDAVRRIVCDSSLEIAEGMVTTQIGETRGAIAHLGSGPRILRVPSCEDEFACNPFQLPADFEPSILSMTAKYDSHDKGQWRDQLLHFARQVFGSIDKIPENDRFLVCMPGLGKEALLWRAFNFQNDHMIFVERNPRNAAQLAQLFKGSHVLNMDFQKGELLQERVREILGKAGRLSVLSVDPDGQWTPDFAHALADFIDPKPNYKPILLADKCLVSLCFSSGRGEDVEWLRLREKESRMDALLKAVRENPTPEGVDRVLGLNSGLARLGVLTDLNELRMRAVAGALAYTLKRRSLGGDYGPGYFEQTYLNHGTYPCDSGNQHMYFATHVLTKAAQ